MRSAAGLLRDLLATEHQALYAYGVLGARLPETERTTALTAVHAHQQVRDSLTDVLRARGADVPGPALGYDVEVADRPQALALALRVETELGVRWRDLVAATADQGVRRLAVLQLEATAVRATSWRRLAGLAATVALPGEVPPGPG